MSFYAKNDIIDLTIDSKKETPYHFQSISKYISEKPAKTTLKKINLKKQLKEFLMS
ncbi:MAG: hypothetical protein P9M11_09755 [Candidatus Tenebribacter burtonii]|jgi:hypothetical protein|nr:hypothetical protein [Candidatus Tenebribacter burtonii]